MLSIVQGFLLPFQGLALILRPGLRRFVVIPLTLNLVVFVALAAIGAHYFEAVMDHWLPAQTWLAFLRWPLWILFAAAYVIVLFYGFTTLANLIASPFNALLAARVEETLTGNPPPAGDESLWQAVGPAIAGELGKLAYLVTRALPLLLLLFVPAVNVFASIAWLAFGFWFLAIEYADYPMGNHALRPAEQRAKLRRKRWKSLAFGAGTTTLMLIPVIQFAAMPAAVAGATRFWIDDL